jgi:hypothetical protein
LPASTTEIAGLNADALEVAAGGGTASAGPPRPRRRLQLGNARLERRDAGFVIDFRLSQFGTQARRHPSSACAGNAHAANGHECRNGLETGHDTVLV